MKVEKIYDYDPSQSEYELAKDNKVFLVIHGAGYSDTPPEEDWVESFNGYSIMDEVANDYVIRNFNTQRLVYFKEIELAEEWNLDEDFMDELWRSKKGKWNTYNATSNDCTNKSQRSLQFSHTLCL